ncbi:hypothetical protein O6H91_07G120100 [Diphasiastrum complanatum]|uniref:Uncharacterized protein n=1 Tax=Diphasiastrum complanatum TaxID=34168 RepID=A0ACC2D9G0_DIPCM|nr:hypothetical protein O6H91_07G120100 [Diphasiastrum complanatum]
MSKMLGKKITGENYLLLVYAFGLFLFLETTRSNPTPNAWPQNFHALLYQNFSGSLAMLDLWYDWPKGRNLHIIQEQLSEPTYDLEWTNGTSFFFDLQQKTCKRVSVPVGILRPTWLADAEYLGVQEVDGFRCHVWEKLDFITYWEDISTKRPVKWVFYTGRSIHVMTYEEGAVLVDDKWQAPYCCFEQTQQEHNSSSPRTESLLAYSKGPFRKPYSA